MCHHLFFLPKYLVVAFFASLPWWYSMLHLCKLKLKNRFDVGHFFIYIEF